MMACSLADICLDITAGPTAIMGLLTGNVVKDLSNEGYSPAVIASAVAFMVGVYSLALGLLKLGFLLDFIPLPVLTGYVSAAALTIIFGQVPTIFGETNIGSTTGDIIHDFFHKLPTTKWQTFLVGMAGILMLTLMQAAGKKWGKQHRVLWYLSLSRNALALVLFTGISYGVNKGRKTPIFAISKTIGAPIEAPRVPNLDLIPKIAARSIPVFIAAALEHLAIGKAFGRRHNYEIDQSQELFYIGITNLIGSFFQAMPITGGFSRTAVNSESGVKSPLSGLITTAVVLVSIYELSGAFWWIPKATLSAIIITAVWQIVIPVKVFYKYWQASFADFIGSMISFWVTLFVSVEIGIAAAVGYSLVYMLLRVAFAQVTHVTASNLYTLYPTSALATEAVPEGTQVFKLHESLLFSNANRVKRRILDTVYTYNSGVTAADVLEKDRLWNEKGAARRLMLRNKAGIIIELPLLRAVILDFGNVERVDTTGVQAIVDLKSDLESFAGESVDLKFLTMNSRVRNTFERSNWKLKSAEGQNNENKLRDGGDMVFDVIQHALAPQSSRAMSGSDIEAVKS